MKEKDEISLECDDMKRHAAELVEKVKNQVEGNECLIDRRMINTFLVQFVSHKSDATTKAHMLDAMSKVLSFTLEEKQALGLVQKPA